MSEALNLEYHQLLGWTARDSEYRPWDPPADQPDAGCELPELHLDANLCISSWALEMLADRKVLIGILEAAIPALEEQEDRQELIRAFNAANKPGQIVAVPDERAERRTLAIAQMAMVRWCATGCSSDSAVKDAEFILKEAERR